MTSKRLLAPRTLYASLATAGLCLALVLYLHPLAAGSDTAAASDGMLQLDHQLLPEASGLAVSRRVEDRFWFLNDSGNAAELIALDAQSERYHRLRVIKVKNRDWEDLAHFTYQGEPWLAIGDIGDNAARRKHVKVHLLPEPAVLDETGVRSRRTLRLRYPDGARDAESMAIDSLTQHLYLLSKRDPKPRLYRVQLPALEEGGEQSLALQYLGTVDSIPGPTDEARQRTRYGKYAAQPTGMSFLPQQGAIALLTYGSVYLAPLDDSRDWLRALNDRLCAVDFPVLRQAEAIAGDDEGRIVITSEGKEAPLVRREAKCVPG